MSNSDAMNSSDQLGLLKDLTEKLGEKIEHIPLAARRIMQRSLFQLLDQPHEKWIPEYYQLGNLTLKWRLFLEKRENKVVFFFFKKKGVFDRSLMTNISATFEPAQYVTLFSKTVELNYNWMPPQFIELEPNKIWEMNVSQDDQKNISDNVLWLNINPGSDDLLAVAFRDEKHKSQVYYFEEGSNSSECFEAEDAPFVWYVKLLKVLRPWIAGQTGKPIPIDIKNSRMEIPRILKTLSKNYVITANKIAIAQSNANSQPSFHPKYRLSDYKADIRLRLKSDGKIHRSNDDLQDDLSEEDLDLFQLMVELEAKRINEKHYINFKILPPDFLIEGPLFDAFIEEISQVKYADKFSRKLDLPNNYFDSVITDYAKEAFIFRVKRTPKHDTQLFVIPTDKEFKTRPLVFSCKFKVTIDKNSVELQGNPTKLIHSKDNVYRLKEEGVKYFMQLLFHVNEWTNKII